MNRCGYCHECSSELQKCLDGEEYCQSCGQYKRYRSHGWASACGDPECPKNGGAVSPVKKEASPPSILYDGINDYDYGPFVAKQESAEPDTVILTCPECKTEFEMLRWQYLIDIEEEGDGWQPTCGPCLGLDEI